MYQATLTRKNQITVPEEVREFLGIEPGERVEWSIEGDKVILKAKRRFDDPLSVIKTLQIDTKKDIKTLRAEAEAEMIEEALK